MFVTLEDVLLNVMGTTALRGTVSKWLNKAIWRMRNVTLIN